MGQLMLRNYEHSQNIKMNQNSLEIRPLLSEGISSAKKPIKNLITVYNKQNYKIDKVRVNRVITIANLRKKIALHFDLIPE